jgi:hypothetical protein
MELIGSSQKFRSDLASQGFAWIPRVAWSVGTSLEPHWQRLCNDWDHLEPDRHLKDGAAFRRRRYGRYYWSPEHGELLPLAHATYFQDESENAYAGGIPRAFAPLLADTMDNPFLHALVRTTFACLPVGKAREGKIWEVRIHQIRITASANEPGQPAPEGIHQDGTDFLTLHLVSRCNIVGGETTVYDLNRRPIERHTMVDPLDSLIFEDPRIMHGVTPVYPADGRTAGFRDILGIDFIYFPHLQRPV